MRTRSIRKCLIKGGASSCATKQRPPVRAASPALLRVLDAVVPTSPGRRPWAWWCFEPHGLDYPCDGGCLSGALRDLRAKPRGVGRTLPRMSAADWADGSRDEAGRLSLSAARVPGGKVIVSSRQIAAMTVSGTLSAAAHRSDASSSTSQKQAALCHWNPWHSARSAALPLRSLETTFRWRTKA